MYTLTQLKDLCHVEPAFEHMRAFKQDPFIEDIRKYIKNTFKEEKVEPEEQNLIQNSIKIDGKTIDEYLKNK